MKEFWKAPLSYTTGEYVYAKVIAINERGSSVTSTTSQTGAQVETVPF
jgi:hypothetical protein